MNDEELIKTAIRIIKANPNIKRVKLVNDIRELLERGKSDTGKLQKLREKLLAEPILANDTTGAFDLLTQINNEIYICNEELKLESPKEIILKKRGTMKNKNIEQLAEITGYSNKTVRRRLNDWEKNGYIMPNEDGTYNVISGAVQYMKKKEKGKDALRKMK